MREILRTSSISLPESARLALEAEGIEAFVSNENLGGLPPAAITVAVVEDGDFERGRSVVRALQQATPSTPTRLHRPRRVLWVLLIILFGAFATLCVSIAWP